MAGSRNVARSARAGSDPINSFMHCCEHHRVLAHAQVIVGTPDGNLILQTMIKGLRKVAGASLQVRKDSISIFASDERDAVQRVGRNSSLPLSLRIRMKSSGTSGGYFRLSVEV